MFCGFLNFDSNCVGTKIFGLLEFNLHCDCRKTMFHNLNETSWFVGWKLFIPALPFYKYLVNVRPIGQTL